MFFLCFFFFFFFFVVVVVSSIFGRFDCLLQSTFCAKQNKVKYDNSVYEPHQNDF